MRDLALRIAEATPPARDRAADALRALAVLGVVIGHWMVTALVVDSGTIRSTSPLKYLPQFTPASWLLQTMAVFFLVGGQMAARGYLAAGTAYPAWIRARFVRLFRPVGPLLGVWGLVSAGILSLGGDHGTVLVLIKLVCTPLWFLLVFAALTAATPLVVRLHPGWPLAAVAIVDLVRYGLAGPEWLGWSNVATAWLVPFCLGAAWARGELNSRGAGWALLLGGAAVTAALVLWAGYPASMVGVTGARVSNQSPPTLALAAFGLAQSGAARLLTEPLRAALRHPIAWAAVVGVNLAALTIFLWHQTAMIAATSLGLLAGVPLPGLHTAPYDAGWVLARLGWLPVFAVALLACCALFHAHERTGRPGSVNVK